MKTKASWFFCALLCLGFLSACHTVQSEIVLMPVLMGTKTMHRADRTGTCINLDRSAIPPTRLALADGELAAGYENTFIRGADPLPCNTRRNFSHQGAILFDFSELERRHAVVTEATLEGTARLVVFPEGIVINLVLNRATQAWAPGNFTGAVNTSDPLAQIPFVPLARGDQQEALRLNLKVTRTVQDWVQNGARVANHGFVFAPLQSHVYAEENENLIVVYSNLSLRLKILEPAP